MAPDDPTARVDALVSRLFACAGEELLVGGVPVGAIADRHGTPLFVYDAGIVDAKLASLRAALPAGFDVFYSVKANPNAALLRHLVGRGCGLEVASAGELHQAVAAGSPPERIVFAGPGKTDRELERALEQGIGELHAESGAEVARIAAIARRLGVRAAVALRVNPRDEVAGGAMRMGGRPAPFGIDEEQLEPVLDRVLSDPVLEFAGIHLFVGTQILDHEVLVAQYRAGVTIAREAAATAGRPVRTLNLGGGLGIPYFPGERELDLDGLQAGLAALAAELDGDPAFEGTRFVLEPGRFLVGEAGVYVVRVVDVKVSRGKTFVITDGGMNHHLAASGNLGMVLRRNFPLAVVSRLGLPPAGAAEVVGPLCTPLDLLGHEVLLPPVEIGDLIGVFQSGAYARSASPLGFLSHRTPPEIWVEDGRDTPVRSRGVEEDYLRDQAVTAPPSSGIDVRRDGEGPPRPALPERRGPG